MSSWGDLNQYADQGDFETTVLGVRGGEDPDRRWYYDKAIEVLPDDLDLSGDEVEEDGMKGDEVTEQPHRLLVVDKDGWIIDQASEVWVRFADLRNQDMQVDGDGYVCTPVFRPLKKGLRDPGSSWYVEQHPTHYNWREDVRALIDSIEAEFDTYANTYEDHPPDWGRDATSVDFWHPDGRGVPIDPTVGQAISTAFSTTRIRQ